MRKKFLIPVLFLVSFFAVCTVGCEIFNSGLDSPSNENSQGNSPGTGGNGTATPGQGTDTSPTPETPQTPEAPQTPGAGGTPEAPQTPGASQPPGTPQPPGTQSTRWYVSATGSDSAAGDSSAAPLATVQAALNKIKSIYRGGKWPAGENAIIVVSGTISATGSLDSNNMAMVNVSGAGNYPPIVLEGDPAMKGVLNANRSSGKGNEGRALYIANNKVTLGDNLTLTGGYTVWGGAVLVGTAGSDSAGEFVMAGGEITGNTAQTGGGVMVYKGSMTMIGGIIRRNTSVGYSNIPGDGGGVYVYEHTSFTFSGGTIRENGGAKTAKGGGVFVDGLGLFTMTDGEILNNSSTDTGGGVQVTAFGKFILSGGIVSGNTSGADGGVSVSRYGGEFVHTGGTVSGNTPNDSN